MRILSAVFLVIAIVYAVLELRRWRSPEMAGVLTHGQKVLRISNFAALLIVVGMAFGGTFLPSGHLSKRMAAFELSFWLGCFLLAALVALTAIVEYGRTVRMARSRLLSAERNEAYQAMVGTLVEAEEKAERREQLPRRNGHG